MVRQQYNNYCLSTFKVTTQCPVMVEILKGHSLYSPVTKSVNVPYTYLQQLWSSIQFVNSSSDPIGPHFVFIINDGVSDHVLRFNLDFLRTALEFPAQTSHPTKAVFDPFPSDKSLLKKIHKLGYDEPLTKVDDFKRKHLSRMWCTIFTIFNRCLTPSNTGMDTASIPILQFLYGFAYHKHLDYAQLTWNQMIKCVTPTKRPYIPFTRFFAIIIRQFLSQKENIARLADLPIVTMKTMKTIQADTGSVGNCVPMKIKSSLLALADQENAHVREYRDIYSLTEHVTPRASSRSELRETSEGSGLKRKRNEGLAADLSDDDNEDVDESAPIEFENRDGVKMIRGREFRKKHVHDLTKRSLGRKKRMAQRSKYYISSVDDQPQDDSDDEPRPFNDDIFEVRSDKEGTEGGVENVNESERSGLEKGQKENVGPSDLGFATQERRDTAGLHVLHSGESFEVGSSQLPQSPPRYSSSSLQEDVLHLHRGEPHTLPGSHLETLGIESEDSRPQSSNIVFTRKKSSLSK